MFFLSLESNQTFPYRDKCLRGYRPGNCDRVATVNGVVLKVEIETAASPQDEDGNERSQDFQKLFHEVDLRQSD